MKLQTLRRTGAATVAVLALSASLAACGDDSDDTAGDTGGDKTSETADPGTTEETTDAPAEDAGADTFGDGCAGVPSDPNDPGSFNGMVQNTVGTAASDNPLLKTLVAAVGAAGLVDALNDPAGTYTVFAPYDDAFGAIPADTLTGLLDGAKTDGPASPLGQILLHHVLDERLDVADVAGDHDTLNKDSVTVEGDESGMTVSTTGADEPENAKVLCGNIQTANATVYVIDTVLTGATVKP